MKVTSEYDYVVDNRETAQHLKEHIEQSIALLKEQGLEVWFVEHGPTRTIPPKQRNQDNPGSTRLCPKCHSPLKFQLSAYPNGEKGEGWFCTRERLANCQYVSWTKTPAHLTKKAQRSFDDVKAE